MCTMIIILFVYIPLVEQAYYYHIIWGFRGVCSDWSNAMTIPPNTITYNTVRKDE